MPRPEPSSARQRQRGSTVRAAPGAAASWIQDHLDAVYVYASRRLNRSDAEDVAQQCFEALFRAQRDGRAIDDAGAYLLGTARRRVADLLRRRARGHEPVALPEGWEAYGDAALPEATLEDSELRALVHAALGFLRGPDARLLIDRYRGGCSVAELARQADATPKAIEARLRRAREAFLERFRIVGRDWVTALDDRPADAGEGTA